MSIDTTASRAQRLTIRQVQKRVVVDVPWDLADWCQEHLRKQGLGSTLVLDTPARTAHLELWTNLRAERVKALLRSER